MNFRRQILLTSKIQVKYSLGLLSNVVVVLNKSSISKVIAGYLLVLVRFSIEIYVKMVRYQIFRHQILLTSKIQVKNSLGLLSNAAYVVLYEFSEYKKQTI